MDNKRVIKDRARSRAATVLDLLVLEEAAYVDNKRVNQEGARSRAATVLELLVEETASVGPHLYIPCCSVTV